MDTHLEILWVIKFENFWDFVYKLKEMFNTWTTGINLSGSPMRLTRWSDTKREAFLKFTCIY